MMASGLVKTLVSKFKRGWVIVALGICSLVAAVALRWAPGNVCLFNALIVDQRPYGKRSGADIRESSEAEQRRASARYSDADLQRMVERLFVQYDPDRANFHALLYAGARPLPLLLKALDDPRTSTMLFPGDGANILDTSPFDRICSLLRTLKPAAAAAPLARYLENPNPMFRGRAALLLATIGTGECLEPVKKALADTDHGVREYALIGLTSEPDSPRRDEKFLSGVFPALVPLLNAGNYAPESPPSAMMAVDTAKAVPILESPRYLSTRNPQLAEVLQALDRRGIKVPRTALLPLLAELEPAAANESPAEVTYAAALALYANNPDDHAETKFRTLINSPSSMISLSAARGLETLAGIDVHDAVSEIYDRRGFDAMTKPQQFCFAVELYQEEVDNGGHQQYFYNDDSDLYRTAIEGMRAMGATSQAAILSDASLAFAPEPPAPTEEGRRHQMEAFDSRQKFIFDTADGRFSDLEEKPGERLDVLTTLYALKHQSDFVIALSAEKGRTAQKIETPNP
jgi:HEAT repeat protein